MTLVFDIDGTLLDPEGKVSVELVGFFDQYTQDREIFLATGKSVAETLSFAERAQIHRAVLICNGGATALDLATRQQLISRYIPDEEKRFVCHLAATKSMAVVAFVDDGIVAYAFSNKMRNVVAETFAEKAKFYEDYYAFSNFVLKEKIYNIWLMPNFLEKDYAKVVQVIGASINKREGVYCVVTKFSNIVVFAQGSTKFAALRAIFAKRGIDLKDAVYFGDGLIDVDCLENCGLGVAVGNAVPEAKAAADEVCAPASENGVYKWLVANEARWNEKSAK